ncbi:MAG: hypothetical protein FJZ43_00640 [Candidatus Staskawiczbacteria bacterium]|nr:hypothetical protein [Candidatus Staskawiczbacteria bacterium]
MQYHITKANIITTLITLFAATAVLYPLSVRFQATQWAFDSHLPMMLFPFFGLLAASLLWLHSLMGAFENWLRKYIPFDITVNVTALIILISLILHPLLLLIGMQFSMKNIYLYYGTIPVTLGIISWLLLISYDVVKALKRKFQFFSKHWNAVLIISNIGFLLSFFHALKIGSTLQSGPTRVVWIFYGITAFLCIAYTYAVKPFFIKK